MTWHPERVERLKELWAAGKSAGQIAREFGLTRNAVVGKIQRANLPPRLVVERKPRPSRARPNNLRVKKEGRTFDPGDRALPVESPKPPACKPVSLLAVRSSECRYPVAEWAGPDAPFYCGAPTMDDCGPYCRWHARIAYQPDSQRRWQTARHPGGVEAMLRRAGA